MDTAEFDKHVNNLENIAAKGQLGDLAKQLHAMAPEDRLAVEKQMQTDANLILIPALLC